MQARPYGQVPVGRPYRVGSWTLRVSAMVRYQWSGAKPNICRDRWGPPASPRVGRVFSVHIPYPPLHIHIPHPPLHIDRWEPPVSPRVGRGRVRGGYIEG